LPDGYLHIKNPNLGKFLRALELKILEYFMAIWNTLLHLVLVMSIWYILWSFGTLHPAFGILYQDKSGKPVGTTEISMRQAETSYKMNSVSFHYKADCVKESKVSSPANNGSGTTSRKTSGQTGDEVESTSSLNESF
jgi:hypothetical protein